MIYFLDDIYVICAIFGVGAFLLGREGCGFGRQGREEWDGLVAVVGSHSGASLLSFLWVFYWIPSSVSRRCFVLVFIISLGDDGEKANGSSLLRQQDAAWPCGRMQDGDRNRAM